MNRWPNLFLRMLNIVILASLFLARAQEQPLPQSPAEIARWVVEDVWNKGDFHLAGQLMAPSIVLHFRGRSILMTPDAATRTVRNWREAFPDFHFRLEDMIIDGNRVALRIPFSGTHQGKFMGLEPTGKKIDVSETLILRIADNKLVEMWEDYDEYGLRLQLGLVKPN